MSAVVPSMDCVERWFACEWTQLNCESTWDLTISSVGLKKSINQGQLLVKLGASFGLCEVVKHPTAVLPDAVGFGISPQCFECEQEILFQQLRELSRCSVRFIGSAANLNCGH